VNTISPLLLIYVAGGIHLGIIAANIPLPSLLKVRKKLAGVEGFIRQIFYVHWFYIVLVLALFAALCFGFPADLAGQKVKLVGMLATAVSNLHQLDAILPAVRNLGSRHRGYGVMAEHYAPVGAALLWTLEQGLGPAFTSDVKVAWGEAYSTLADAMQGAMTADAPDQVL